MKLAMFDKIMAVGLVLVVYGMTAFTGTSQGD